MQSMGAKGLLVGAETQVLCDSVQDIAVARRLLPDVQLHHPQPKALHLQTTCLTTMP